jgi:hypothetical protein
MQALYLDVWIFGPRKNIAVNLVFFPGRVNTAELFLYVTTSILCNYRVVMKVSQ